MSAEALDATTLPFDNTYARLAEGFFARVRPTPVEGPALLRLNEELAETLGLAPSLLRGEPGLALLSGNVVPEGADPLAMVYAGHQFGQFVPRLGDGRAVLLGELVGVDGVRRDLQLKGAGPTPFSRQGDGRAALGPVLREYVVSEAMAGLGIPTTRALAMVTTGEPVYRESALPGAVLTRVARSHIRVGTFQYFYARGEHDAVRALADYAMARLYPDAAEAAEPYAALLAEVVQRQAELVAAWMGVGFIHGVMNTDNCSIAGETIDYGPCAFLDSYHPETVFSSIDRGGRYAYNQQPAIAYWNLARFAETLLPLLGDGEEESVAKAQDALSAFPPHFETRFHTLLRQKLGLADEREGDVALASDLLEGMAAAGADYTATFRALCDLEAAGPGEADGPLRALFAEPHVFDAWAVAWRARLRAEGSEDVARQHAMRRVNPTYIPRNHRVQEAIDAATEGNLEPLDTLLRVVTAPYEAHEAHAAYRDAPAPDERVTRTFCGT